MWDKLIEKGEDELKYTADSFFIFPTSKQWRQAFPSYIEYFNPWEFGDKNKANDKAYFAVSQVLVDNLDILRLTLGRPITITSGYRSPGTNKAVGGSENSYHLFGMAADFTTKYLEDTYKLLLNHKELSTYFKGVGYYPDRNFIHVDVRNTDEQVTWVK